MRSTRLTIRSCRAASAGEVKSMVRMGRVPTYCFVQVTQPPRNTLLIDRSCQNKSLEFSNPQHVARQTGQTWRPP